MDRTIAAKALLKTYPKASVILLGIMRTLNPREVRYENTLRYSRAAWHKANAALDVLPDSILSKLAFASSPQLKILLSDLSEKDRNTVREFIEYLWGVVEEGM